ncbi:MAG: serine/threonine-protein kinase [Polyangiaceae bacterium]
MTGAAPLESGRIVAGRYRIDSRIGEGGMGSVYLVRHVNTDESLALKVLHAHVLRDANAVERFRREARAPARVNSEHVARVTDADTAPDLDNAPFYVMEYLRGKDLEHTLVEGGPLSPALVVEYLRQAARALDKAHAIGIVHRDLKPENLFLTHRDDGSPCIKLLDFGIARLGDASAPSQMQTQAGFVFGTPAFMAPEQMVGNVDLIGPSTDVWAIGIVAFKLLTGLDFWGAKTPAQLCAMILTQPIVPPSTQVPMLGFAFDAWFARCVTRETGDRFQSAGTAVAALGDALGVRVERREGSSASFVAAEEAVPDLARGTQPMMGAAVRSNPPPPFRVESTPPPAFSDAPPPRRGRAAAVIAGMIVLVGVVGVVGYQVVVRSRKAPDSRAGLVSSAASPSAPSLAASEAPTEAPSASAAPTAEPVKLVAKAAPTDKSAKPKDVAPPAKGATLTSDQRLRLESLQRMCDQGTFTPAECQAKRVSITSGP